MNDGKKRQGETTSKFGIGQDQELEAAEFTGSVAVLVGMRVSDSSASLHESSEVPRRLRDRD